MFLKIYPKTQIGFVFMITENNNIREDGFVVYKNDRNYCLKKVE
jgi:UDP-3-O-[3-hydroxymyristoyl] glucosamine N-acyltransferase